MRVRIYLLVTIAVLSFVGLKNIVSAEQIEQEKKKVVLAGTIEGLEVTNIISKQLEFVEDVEVVVSHLVIPPNTELPKHWHPGEEFQYILEGSTVVWQKNKPETQLNKGDVFHVPLRQIHSARALADGASVLVFRVHEAGKPVSTKVE